MTENISTFINSYGINDPPTNSHKDLVYFRRQLDAAINEKVLRSYQQALNQQDIDTLRRVDTLIERAAYEEANEGPPAWFSAWSTSISEDLSNIKSDITTIKGDITTMKGDITTIKGDITNMKEDIISLKTLSNLANYKAVRNENRIANERKRPLAPLPFLDGTFPPDNLPVISNVEDIDTLTKEQCKEYLKGYGIPFNPNENTQLKTKLRVAVGFDTWADEDYTFHRFSHQ